MKAANFCSNSRALGPVVSHPERSVSTTALISSSSIEGTWKLKNVSLTMSEKFSIGGLPKGLLCRRAHQFRQRVKLDAERLGREFAFCRHRDEHILIHGPRHKSRSIVE